MAKIYIPSVNEYREITQIVAFGCSMVAGAELLDQERYPTTDVESMKKINLRKWNKFKMMNPVKNEPEFLHREGQMAWATELAREYNIPCHNYAQGATGFGQQLTQFLKAKRHGLITPTTLVVWGLTSKDRGIWLQDYTVQSYMLNGMMDPPEVKDSFKDFWYHSVNSEYLMLWHYYQNLHTMLTWAESICNDQFMFVQSLSVRLDIRKMAVWELERLRNPNFVEFMIPFWDILEPKYNKYQLVTEPEHTFFDWAKKQPNGLLGGGHPTVSSHTHYAKFLNNVIEDRRLARLTEPK